MPGLLVALTLSFGVAFVAELGGKSQLMAMMLATRHRARTVLLGVTLATTAVHTVSVTIGYGLGSVLPMGWISVAAAALFLGLGMWMLGTMSHIAAPTTSLPSPKSLTIAVFVAFFVAELGDRTMIATITLAAQYDWLGVWLGSTLGMVTADALAIAVGRRLGRRLPQRMVIAAAGILFGGFGVWLALDASDQLGAAHPLVGAIALLALGAVAVGVASIAIVVATRMHSPHPAEAPGFRHRTTSGRYALPYLASTPCESANGVRPTLSTDEGNTER